MGTPGNMPPLKKKSDNAVDIFTEIFLVGCPRVRQCCFLRTGGSVRCEYKA